METDKLSENERKKKIEEYRLQMNECAKEIEGILKKYIDMDSEYYKLVTIWIIGCYFHKLFETYPYLYFNAMRGSGKTRTLKLISTLTNGLLLLSMTESVLFRIPKHTPLFIDETESIGNKEKSALREILNASYKRGLKVLRAKKVKTNVSEEYVLEAHEPFKPISLANIYGMEEVLGDRAIRLVLERSSAGNYSLLMENFDTNPEIQDLKARIQCMSAGLCELVLQKELVEGWNNYITLKKPNIHIIHPTLTTLNCINKDPNGLNINTQIFYDEILDTGITGRNLELFFPLFLVANMIDDVWVAHLVKIAKRLVNERKEEEVVMSKDVMLYDFISRQAMRDIEFIPIKELTWQFREYLADEEQDERWLNTMWMGRALTRLNLIFKKRRMSKGMEVVLDWKKASEKIKLFKEQPK